MLYRQKAPLVYKPLVYPSLQMVFVALLAWNLDKYKACALVVCCRSKHWRRKVPQGTSCPPVFGELHGISHIFSHYQFCLVFYNRLFNKTYQLKVGSQLPTQPQLPIFTQNSTGPRGDVLEMRRQAQVQDLLISADGHRGKARNDL